MKRNVIYTFAILVGSMLFTINPSEVTAGVPAPSGELGQIENGSKPDGKRCYYCGPHEYTTCSTNPRVTC